MTLIDADYFNTQMKTLGLKSTFTPEADVLDVLIGEASEWVEAYCGRKFGTQNVTESHRGRNARRLLLREWPVSSVASVTWVDDTGATGTEDTSLMTILDGGMLEWKRLSYGPWRTDRIYTVTYALAGPVPGPVKRATALKVADLLQPQYTGPREKAVELVTNIQEQIVDLLEEFRRERIG